MLALRAAFDFVRGEIDADGRPRADFARRQADRQLVEAAAKLRALVDNPELDNPNWIARRAAVAKEIVEASRALDAA